MLKKILKNFSLTGAERELKNYVHNLSAGTREQQATILAHAALIYGQLIKKLPIVETVIATKDDVYGKEIARLILQTNSLLNEYHRSGEMTNAAGLKVWNETFRCLAHPELTQYGKIMWDCLFQISGGANEYLTNWESEFQKKGNTDMVFKINEAKRWITVVPARYKS